MVICHKYVIYGYWLSLPEIIPYPYPIVSPHRYLLPPHVVSGVHNPSQGGVFHHRAAAPHPSDCGGLTDNSYELPVNEEWCEGSSRARARQLANILT